MISCKNKTLAAIFLVIVVGAAALGFALTKHQPNQTIASNAQNNQIEQTPSTSAPTLTPTNMLSPSPALAPTATPPPTPFPTATVPPTPTKPFSDALELSLSLEKTVFNFGEPVNVTLAITNVSQEKINFSSFGMNFDFIVYNSTNNLIYQYSKVNAYQMIVTIVPLPPGEAVRETYVWPQTLGIDPRMANVQVSPGTYFIIGESPIYHLQTAPAQITILSP